MIIRFFNTYGPRMKGDDFYGRVVDRFVRQALTGRPITVYADGTQTRSFTYVSDTVTAVVHVMEARTEGVIYNIGNDSEIRIGDLAKLVREVTHSKSEITYHPLAENDPTRRAADISKIRALGWEHRVSLEEGIREVAKYYQGHEFTDP